MNRFQILGAIVGTLLALGIISTISRIANESNEPILCLEPTGDGRMMYGPYVLEYRATTESPLYNQDGSEAPVGSYTILFVPHGERFSDLFTPGSARFWVEGSEKETRAPYDSLTRGIPGAESGVAVTITDDSPIYCP